MTERLSLRKMANELGYSYETIRKWYLQGMPDDNADDAQEWIDENIRHKIIGRDDSEDSQLFIKARAEREVIRAEMEKIKLGLREHRFYEKRFADPFMFDLFRRVRDALLLLPERIAHTYDPRNPERYRQAWRKGVEDALAELDAMVANDCEGLHRALDRYIGEQEADEEEAA